jgi:SAM-dependent methyltransferase
MRSSAEKQLHNQQNFVSINGSAEATTLKNQSIDILVAAQAFHWFNPEPTRKEFQRILKPSGWIALIWNKRDSESDAFHRGYETVLKNMIPEYSQVNHHKIDDKARESFFGHKNIVKQSYSNYQEFDWDGLKGRILSSSYVPKDGQSNHDRIINGLHELFQKYQTRERIRMNYLTEVYAGQF